MNFRETAKIVWSASTTKERYAIVAGIALVVVLIVSGWVDSIISNYKVRKAESAAAVAKVQASESLRKASVIAENLAKKESELKDLEAKINVRKKELDNAHQQTSDAQRDYDRAVREPVGNAPSSEQLCAELAAIGYPCR
jgi:flagellar biosynthesis/type III secretory pathway M-ring protein FliF/YscJ